MTAPSTNPDSRSLEMRIRSFLSRVARHSQIAGVYHDMKSRSTALVGPGFCRLCRGCLRHPQAAAFCHSNACTTALQGHSIGDAWHFRCWLGIDGFAIPVAPEDSIAGAVEFAGWFPPGDKQASLDRVLSRLANLDSQAPTERYVSALQAMPEMSFPQVQAVAEFALQSSFSEGLNRSDIFEFRQRVSAQRQRLNARLQKRNPEQPPQAALQAALASMANTLSTGGSQQQRLIDLDEVLCSILLDSGEHFDRVRAGLSAVLSTLMRERVRRGEAWKPALTRFEQEIMELDGCKSVEEAFLRAEEWLLHRKLTIQPFATPAAQTQPPLPDRILSWMREKYPAAINLRQAAEELGASLSSITHRLKKETGKGFSEHLRTIRVNEAKRLLAYTDLNLSEIAERCGFKDPSYFTKVFRAEINLTPSEFRKMLD